MDAPSIRRQCELIGLNRASWYAQERPAAESEENLALMRRIDEIYTAPPFYGSRKMTTVLRREGHAVNRKRVRRLHSGSWGCNRSLRVPILAGRIPRIPSTPTCCAISWWSGGNQVWATDITYIRIERGFAYLVAVMDWHSRKVLAWRLSNSLDTESCVEALQEALRNFGPPEIFNTDQGCQFTSRDFTGVLQAHAIRYPHDILNSKGEAMQLPEYACFAVPPSIPLFEVIFSGLHSLTFLPDPHQPTGYGYHRIGCATLPDVSVYIHCPPCLVATYTRNRRLTRRLLF
jgi:transposase InsO family protein